VEWFGFVVQWFPGGSHGGTPRTFGMFGLYQRAGGIGGLFKLLTIKQQVIPETIPSPSFDALKCSCQSCRVDTISL